MTIQLFTELLSNCLSKQDRIFDNSNFRSIIFSDRLNFREFDIYLIRNRSNSQECGIDGQKVIEYIAENKDVDGLTTITAGKLLRGETDFFVPCSPRACMELISRAGLDLTGATAVVLGRCKVRLLFQFGSVLAKPLRSELNFFP